LLLTRLCRHVHYSSVVNNLLHEVKGLLEQVKHSGTRYCPRNRRILCSVHITLTSQGMAVYCPSAGQSIFLILWHFMTIQAAVVAPLLFAAMRYLETTFECNISQSYTAYIC
jgi:hypothetical protein